MSKAHNSDAPDKMAVNPTAAQQELLDRIETQRERIRARRSGRCALVSAHLAVDRPPPPLGADNAGILAELGYDAAAIEHLRQEKAI